MLDHLRSAFNVGSIIRTADCLGVQQLLLCGYTATPEDAQVQRTAMGAHSHVAWEWRRDTAAALDRRVADDKPAVDKEGKRIVGVDGAAHVASAAGAAHGHVRRAVGVEDARHACDGFATNKNLPGPTLYNAIRLWLDP